MWGRGERPQGPAGGGERQRGGGGAESEGWIGGSDAILYGETEEDRWGQAPLTASPWDTQESGAGGLGRRIGRKVPSATADKGETRGRHGAKREQGGKKGGRQGWEKAEPLGVGVNLGGRESSGVDPDPHEVEGEEGGREASGVDPDPHEVEWEEGGCKASRVTREDRKSVV